MLHGSFFCFLLFCFISAYVNLMRVTFGENKVFILNVNSSMELSEVHNKEVLILNWLPVYGLRLSLAICASEKLIVSGRQFSNEIPRRLAGCSQKLLKINILT